MSDNALPVIGNFYVYLIVFANNVQIKKIKYKYIPFGDFSIQLQIHQNSVFKYIYKYVF